MKILRYDIQILRGGWWISFMACDDWRKIDLKSMKEKFRIFDVLNCETVDHEKTNE